MGRNRDSATEAAKFSDEKNRASQRGFYLEDGIAYSIFYATPAGTAVGRLGSISPMRLICAPTPRNFSSIRS